MSTDLLVDNDVAPSGGSVWAYVSPSRLNCWLSCPLKFRLRYVDGIRTPTTKSLFLGKAVHRGLEIFNRHRMLGITLEFGEVAAKLMDGWDAAVAEEEMAFTDAADEIATKNQAVGLVDAYLSQLPSDEPIPTAVEATMETPLVDPFTGENLGVPLLGVVDLISRCDDGQVIVDFKTSSRSSPPFEVTHEIQLSCYSYLFRAMSGREESRLEIRSIVKTKRPKVETQCYAARTDRHLRRLFSIIREYLDAVHSGRFNFRPGWACSMCDHRDGPCRAWAG